MLILSVVGGVASGKTLVTEQFASLGAGILDGDRAGHAVLREKKVREAIRKRFGDSVLDRLGQIDRPTLAAIVFAASPQAAEALRDLEAITHPRIGERLEEQAAELAASGVPVAVLDAAVMSKAGWDQRCDYLVFVDAPREMRALRARERGWSDEQFTHREAAQKSILEKKQAAHLVIDNAGLPEETREQVVELWKSLGLKT